MYYETDMMGLTHHSNYVRFMEEARVDFLEKIGFPYEKLEGLGIMSPVIGIECRFREPSTFADVLEIDVKIDDFHGARLSVSYEMRNQRGDIICTARSEHCFTDKSGKPVRLMRACPELGEKLVEMMGGRVRERDSALA